MSAFGPKEAPIIRALHLLSDDLRVSRGQIALLQGEVRNGIK